MPVRPSRDCLGRSAMSPPRKRGQLQPATAAARSCGVTPNLAVSDKLGAVHSRWSTPSKRRPRQKARRRSRWIGSGASSTSSAKTATCSDDHGASHHAGLPRSSCIGIIELDLLRAMQSDRRLAMHDIRQSPIDSATQTSSDDKSLTMASHGRPIAQTRRNRRESKTASIDNQIVQKFTCSPSTYALLLAVEFCYIPRDGCSRRIRHRSGPARDA